MTKETVPTLGKGETVKNLKKKIENAGKPSIFIGSVSESIWIAEAAQRCFDPELYEVDVWHQGIFELTKSHGGEANNAEQLKNFTDIYDFAIFIFSPDDKIVSQFRKDPSGEFKQAFGTRHNIVFEFGLFLGRIGAKKSFILFDNDSADFVHHFFTDLKENINDVIDIPDSKVDDDKQFRVEIYPYKGNSGQVQDMEQRKKEFDYADLAQQIVKIKLRINKCFTGIDVSFLPSTSLAIGYYKNFIKIVLENIHAILSGNTSEKVLKILEENIKMNGLVTHLLNSKTRQIKIVLPNSIEAASPEAIKPFVERCSETREIPGQYRNMTICFKKDIDKNSFIVYDFPTTMFSSVEAVDMLNPHKNIRELLSQKEKVNFVKVLKYKIENEPKLELRKTMQDIIVFITWDDFLAEIENNPRPSP